MTALRMNGTPRPARDDTATIARKIIRTWFERNPRSIVSSHWRWNELPASSREALSMPRKTHVYPNRIVFESQSEFSLKNVTGCIVTDDGKLQIFLNNPGQYVEYTAA